MSFVHIKIEDAKS